MLYLYVYKHNSHNRYVYMYLKPLLQKLKLVVNDTNDFLKKLNELRDLPDDFISCTIDVAG